jgi:hypothetical protein
MHVFPFTWLHELELTNGLQLKVFRGEGTEAAVAADQKFVHPAYGFSLDLPALPLAMLCGIKPAAFFRSLLVKRQSWHRFTVPSNDDF